ncbi:MAG TPA: tetratricopeptide repeat protein, partial [Thermoanaerobaculia bacterium]|nr:tetratricopeptide repeat protein [Thermoanaerobaculia bacterium]
MKRVLFAVLALAVLAGGVLLLARYERYEWTTASPTALAEFEAGVESIGKLYFPEAVAHLEAAVEADPDFAAAHLYLMQALNRSGAATPQRISAVIESLRETDLERLNERERALVSHYLARIDGDYERAYEIVDDYLADHPDDPFLLERHCLANDRIAGDSGEIEACLDRLIEIDPNRVQALNMLAYMAFDRGAFDDAAERFELYRYLAPDQANPHDSFGELLMVTGRYDQAASEFRQAIGVKQDFCASWDNLMTVELLRRDAAAAARVLDEMVEAEGCPEPRHPLQRCRVEMWSLILGERWPEAYEKSRDGCGPNPIFGDSSYLGIRAALASGHPEASEEVIEVVSEWFRKERGVKDARHEVPFVALLVGLHESAAGDHETAIESLRFADEKMIWGGGMGTNKLYSRLERAAAQATSGQS